MLQIRQAKKRYGDVVALDAVDLVVEDGETVSLVGPSGCGKSTLLRAIIALVSLDGGEVLLRGAPLAADAAAGEIAWRRRLGYVIQHGGLFPHLTVRGNLALQARHFGWDDPRIDARIAELLELVRLAPALLCRHPGQLSGGQRQRVGLVRALMLDPEVLLLDEPLGALDPLIRADLQRDLREIFAELGKTVVLVTHDLAEARFLGHRVVLMRDGAIVQQGRFDELLERPATPFVRRFVRAQRQLAEGRLEVDDAMDDPAETEA
ncbi:MAG: ATP-binding cassette domain-containing protein [Acidobacteriota bacterium]